MRDRVPLFVLLASSLTFLVSLFLPWRDITTSAFVFGTGQGRSSLSNGSSVIGWIGIAGDAAVLVVVAIALAAVVALRSPRLASRLPIGSLGVALGYFAIGVAWEVHFLSQEFSGGFTGRPRTPHSSWTYGFYLGLASAGIAMLSALALRRNELVRLRGAADAIAAVLGVGLFVSYLLPWYGFRGPLGVDDNIRGIASAGAAIAALVLILVGGWLYGEAGRRWRLPLAVAIAVLTGGAASSTPPGYADRYGAWIGVGCAVALVAVEAARALPLRLPAPPKGPALARIGAAVLLLVALFLPWRELHGGGVSGASYDGWYSATGAAAGGLCLLLLATPILPALETYVLDVIVAVVIFVSVAGTAFREESLFYRVGYGAFVGFVAAGTLLVTAFVPLRAGYVDRMRARARVVPLAASVLCVAAVVVPSWFVLPQDWTFQASALDESLAVPGVLLALYLIRLWALRVRGPADTGGWLTLLPLILLTLASLQLVHFRNSGVVWGAVILVALSLLLAFYGWMEEDRGVEGLRIPDEIWRVDRLPEAEG